MMNENDVLNQYIEWSNELSEKREKKKSNRVQGRWNYLEHCVYLEAVMLKLPQKEMIREIRKFLPNRTGSQIRAHHQKMITRYQGHPHLLLKCYLPHGPLYKTISHEFDDIILQLDTIHTHTK